MNKDDDLTFRSMLHELKDWRVVLTLVLATAYFTGLAYVLP